MSQFSQCNESGNYENASTFKYQNNMSSQYNQQVKKTQQNVTYGTQSHSNSSSTSNKFNLRFVDT